MFTRRLHQVVKYAYHQIIDLRNRETKTITAPIPNLAFVLLHSFQRTSRICETIEFVRPTGTAIGISGIEAWPISTNLSLMVLKIRFS